MAAHFGRRELPRLTVDAIDDPAAQHEIGEYFAETADYIEVLRRLWDSWEDDAEIRDVASGRFIDRHKLHYIDFEGRWFSVKGPSITPRPPQGQPIVAALGHGGVSYELIASSADVGFVTPHDAAEAAEIAAEIAALQLAAGRRRDTVHVFGDLLVFLDRTPQAARARPRPAGSSRRCRIPKRRRDFRRYSRGPRRCAAGVACGWVIRIPAPTCGTAT